MATTLGGAVPIQSDRDKRLIMLHTAGGAKPMKSTQEKIHTPEGFGMSNLDCAKVVVLALQTCCSHSTAGTAARCTRVTVYDGVA